REYLREYDGGVGLGHRRWRDVAQTVQVGEVLILATTHVIADGNPGAVMRPVQQVDPEAFSGRQIRKVTIPDIDQRPRFCVIGGCAVVQRLKLYRGPERYAPARRRRFKKIG